MEEPTQEPPPRPPYPPRAPHATRTRRGAQTPRRLLRSVLRTVVAPLLRPFLRGPECRPRPFRIAAVLAAFAVLGAAVAVPLSRGGAPAAPGGTVPGPGATAQPAAGRHWVGSWQAADQRGRPVDLTHRTVRMTMRTTLGGSAVRVRVSNALGDRPLEIGSASVALQQKDAETIPNTVRPLQFSGRRAVTVAPGARLYSDPVALALPDRTSVMVTLYLPAYRGLPTSHGAWGSSHRSTFMTNGDHTDDARGAAFQRSAPAWYFVDGVDIAAKDPRAGAVVAFGDSITDGTGSSTDTDHRWPDLLDDRLAGTDEGRRTAVLNGGIAGNRILTTTPRSIAAERRAVRDAFDAPGVRTVVLLLGTNDIGNGSATASQVVAGIQNIAEEARHRGLRVIGGTLTPAYGCACGHGTVLAAHAREDVNRWIRGSRLFDGVIDFAHVVRDPRDHRRLNPAYDSGDHLHPNDRGYQAMAHAVDLSLLAPPAAADRAGGAERSPGAALPSERGGARTAAR